MDDIDIPTFSCNIAIGGVCETDTMTSERPASEIDLAVHRNITRTDGIGVAIECKVQGTAAGIRDRTVERDVICGVES